MADVTELSQWAVGLRWAEEQWEKIALQEESISIDERECKAAEMILLD